MKIQSRKIIATLMAFGLVAGQQLPFLSLNNQNTVRTALACSTEVECRELLEEANRELSGFRSEESRLNDEISDLASQIEEKQEQIGGLEAEIARLQEEIEAYEQEIAEKEAEIRKGEEELELINEEIEELNVLIGERMQAAQRNRFNNVWLELLSQSADLLSLVRNFNMMSSLAEHDTRIMEHLAELVERQENILAQLELQREELAAAQQVLVNRRLEEEAQITILAGLQAELSNTQQLLGSEREAIRREMYEAQEIADIAQEQLRHFEALRNPQNGNGGGGNSQTGSGGGGISSSITPGGGDFIIPLERGRVTCEFGNSCYFGHTGIDMQLFGATGVNRVLAAASGTVTRAGFYGGWGNMVIITHNINGEMWSTAYAHLHTLPYVSVGDFVEQGTVIGRQGTSGNTIGSGHLHFEVHRGAWTWGGALNPRNFVHFPSSW